MMVKQYANRENLSLKLRYDNPVRSLEIQGTSNDYPISCEIQQQE